jgi:hypothetical protein
MIALFISAAVYGQHRDRKGVIHVQGHPHELLNKLHGGKEDVKKVPQLKVTSIGSTSTDNIILDSVKCWAGSPDPTLPVDSAVLLVKFTVLPDVEYARDSILIWGYRWNPVDKYGYDVTKYTADMIRAIANADCRFSVLLQSTGALGFTVGGFGYNYDDRAGVPRAPVTFSQAGAAADTAHIKFHYTDSPNCEYAQGAIPYDVSAQWQEADRRAGTFYSSVAGDGNGVIRHPFDADYGYPAYDYDYWQLFSVPAAQSCAWQSGWYYNYWAFYTKDQLNGPFVSSPVGISSREIHQGYVDGFVLDDPNAWPPLHDMSGSYAGKPCSCGCTGVNASVEQNGKRK